MRQTVKTCTTCGATKPLDEFGKVSEGKRAAKCKKCLAARNNAYKKNQYDRAKQDDPAYVQKRIAYAKAWKEKNPAKHKARVKAWLGRAGAADQRRLQRKVWDEANPGVRKAKHREWMKHNRARINEQRNAKRAERRAELAAAKAAYYETNRAGIEAERLKEASERKERYKTRARMAREAYKLQFGISLITANRRANPQYLLRSRLRARLQKLVAAGFMKAKPSTFALIGCTGHELRLHIERQFVPGMSWYNRTLWHIDHIRPCSTFDLNDPAQQALCFHHTNLRPLWVMQNLTRPKDGSDYPHPKCGNYGFSGGSGVSR